MTKLDFLKHAKTRQIHVFIRNGLGDSISVPCPPDVFYSSVRVYPDSVFDAFRVTMTERSIYFG